MSRQPESYDATTARCVMTHSREPERPRPARHGYLCVGHYEALEKALPEVPVLWDESEQAMVRGSGVGPKITGTKDVGLRVDDTLSKARLGLRDCLASWASMVSEEHPDGLHPPRFGADPCSAFLSRWLPWIAEQLWVDDFAGELHDSVRALRSAVRPIHKRQVDLGLCDVVTACDVETTEEMTCEGIMRAVVCSDDDLFPASIACTACGTAYASTEWRSLARRLIGSRESMLTVTDLSQLYRIPPGTIRRWAVEDEWRKVTETDERGSRNRYHADDAQRTYDAHQPKQEAG